MSYFFDDIKPYDNRDMSSSEDEAPTATSYSTKKTVTIPIFTVLILQNHLFFLSTESGKKSSIIGIDIYIRVMLVVCSEHYQSIPV